MNTPVSQTLSLTPKKFGLLARLAVVAAVLAIETLLYSMFVQSQLYDLAGAAQFVHIARNWAFRFLIAYAATFAILLYLRAKQHAAAGAAGTTGTTRIEDAPTSLRWLAIHAALFAAFVFVGSRQYQLGSSPFWMLSIGWHLLGLAAALALVLAVAPQRSWIEALQRTGPLPFYAVVPAAAAVILVNASELLWAPAAALTFRLVLWMARPFNSSLISDPSTLTLITKDFSVQVTELCSGLEGVGLILVFCVAWLWYFRRDYLFPRALIILPVAVLLMFLLNAARIAGIVLIGAAGYQRVAAVGFHSQAGWIAFNLAAFGLAFAAKHSSWLNKPAPLPKPARADAAPVADSVIPTDATAAYLVPLLSILAAGMVAHALSAGFDLLYPLRLLCAAIALFVFRRSYRNLDWNFSWRGVLAGAAIFVAWAVFARFTTSPEPMPGDLGDLSGPLRMAWIACRVAAAIITVPIAEELAYRGFLMRRVVSADFSAISFESIPWWAIGISAAVFGISHGSFWLPGMLAGVVYALVTVRTGRIGESVAAHATTNSLVAIQVLLFGHWQLW